jgi:hypothetical protein
MENSNIEEYIEDYLIKNSEKDNNKIKKRIATIITVFISIFLFLVIIAGLTWLAYSFAIYECTCPPNLCGGCNCHNYSCDVCSDRHLRPIGFLFISTIFLSLFYLIPFLIRESIDD